MNGDRTHGDELPSIARLTVLEWMIAIPSKVSSKQSIMRIRVKREHPTSKPTKKAAKQNIANGSHFSSAKLLTNKKSDDQRSDLPSHPKRRSRSKSKGPAPKQTPATKKKETVEKPKQDRRKTIHKPSLMTSKATTVKNKVSAKSAVSSTRPASAEAIQNIQEETITLRIRKPSPSPVTQDEGNMAGNSRLESLSMESLDHDHEESIQLDDRTVQKLKRWTKIRQGKMEDATRLNRTTAKSKVDHPSTVGAPNGGVMRTDKVSSNDRASGDVSNLVSSLIACSASPFVCIETICCVPIEEESLLIKKSMKVSKGKQKPRQVILRKAIESKTRQRPFKSIRVMPCRDY